MPLRQSEIFLWDVVIFSLFLLFFFKLVIHEAPRQTVVNMLANGSKEGQDP